MLVNGGVDHCTHVLGIGDITHVGGGPNRIGHVTDGFIAVGEHYRGALGRSTVGQRQRQYRELHR